jgi:HK97 family phage prohead protease
MDNNMERRFAELTLRAAGDGNRPVIEGEAAVFDTETTIGSWFREVIRPGAFRAVLSESPDVIGAFNHDWSFVLGRTSSGTMKLEETKTGLRYVIDVNPNDSQAMSVYEKVKRGDVTQSSFAFTVKEDRWNDPKEGEELKLREITQVGKLFDVGPVPFAAYPEASAQARSKSEMFLQQRSAQAASGDAEGLKASQKVRQRKIELAEKSIYSK